MNSKMAGANCIQLIVNSSNCVPWSRRIVQSIVWYIIIYACIKMVDEIKRALFVQNIYGTWWRTLIAISIWIRASAVFVLKRKSLCLMCECDWKEKPTQSQAPSLMFMFHKRQIFLYIFLNLSQSVSAYVISQIRFLPIKMLVLLLSQKKKNLNAIVCGLIMKWKRDVRINEKFYHIIKNNLHRYIMNILVIFSNLFMYILL